MASRSAPPQHQDFRTNVYNMTPVTPSSLAMNMDDEQMQFPGAWESAMRNPDSLLMRMLPAIIVGGVVLTVGLGIGIYVYKNKAARQFSFYRT